jgi:hypothetical protein
MAHRKVIGTCPHSQQANAQSYVRMYKMAVLLHLQEKILLEMFFMMSYLQAHYN